ncbi:ABC transporter ATP-binding protein [Micromonospora chokoriensis]
MVLDNQISDAVPAGRQATAAPLLHAAALVKTYGATRALDRASLEVRAGEVLGLTGPSGSGKSTLMHCLSGIISPDSGQVSFAGRDLAVMSDGERSALRRRTFGFVFQFGHLVPELTCLENVALPLRLNGTRRAAAARRAIELLDRLEVTDVADKRPGQASGGQGQRVAIARAMVSEPQVIFADEPTGALDSLNSERVMQLLVDVARERQTAIVLVTHDAQVASYADRKAVVRDGKVTDAWTGR